LNSYVISSIHALSVDLYEWGRNATLKDLGEEVDVTYFDFNKGQCITTAFYSNKAACGVACISWINIAKVMGNFLFKNALIHQT
jgi:hypothetical protein